MKVKELLAALEVCDLASDVLIDCIVEDDGRINFFLSVEANSVRPGLGGSIIISENNVKGETLKASIK